MPRRNERSSPPLRTEPVLAAENNFAGVRLNQAEQHAGESRLAAAGFADDAESFAAAQGEADAVYGQRAASGPREWASGEGVRFSQVARFEQGFRGHSYNFSAAILMEVLTM